MLFWALWDGFLLPDKPEKSCSAWNVREESFWRSRRDRIWTTTSCWGFVCGVREGPATQRNFCLQWSPERSARTSVKNNTPNYSSLSHLKKQTSSSLEPEILFKYCLFCEELLCLFGGWVCFFFSVLRPFFFPLRITEIGCQVLAALIFALYFYQYWHWRTAVFSPKCANLYQLPKCKL